MGSKYHESFPLMAEGYAREGMTDVQIAEKLHISTTALNRYQKKYPEFAEALRRGKLPVDTDVENSLLKKACGYSRREEYIENSTECRNGNTVEREKRRIVIKDVPPDTAAAIFWLRNRRPDKWNDKQRDTSSEIMNLYFDKEDEDL